ncbi:MAG: hypothetical protein K2F81_04460 [Ruminococcus sp.]|nr:hypothetical protein [Ruminococcus sp.]
MSEYKHTNKMIELLVKIIMETVILLIIVFIASKHTKSKIIGKWEQYAKSNTKGDLEILEEDEKAIFKFLKDGRVIQKEYHNKRTRTQLMAYEIKDEKLYISRGEYSRNYRIKEINNKFLVLYDLSNPILEYYFKRL